MTPRATRAWGYWSQAKLQILERYLKAFLQASSGVSERIYLDAFAGSGRGRDRLTGEEFEGSARIALNAMSGQHGFTRFLYFEQESLAATLERKLRSEHPERDIKVFGGDCNSQIPAALRSLSTLRWAPTFAFLDPDGLELAWTTLQALAEHKRGYRAAGSGKPENKVELWLLFSSQGLVRTLAFDEAKRSPLDEERASRLFGNDDWRAIYERRQRSELTAPEAKEQYVNLMRWRLTHDLGYSWAHSLELKNMVGGTMYHMIFATDNAAGNRIMTSLYARAAREIPDMRRDAIDRQRGQLSFALATDGDPAPPYAYEPPWPPHQTSE